jgi:hypothetical protein
MLKTYRYLAMAIGTLVVVQAAAIAWAMFRVAKTLDDSGSVTKDAWENSTGLGIHAFVGQTLIPLLALILLIVGILLRRIPGAMTWAIVVFVLVVVQIGFAYGGAAAPFVGVFHGLTALLLLLAAFKAVTVVPKEEPAATSA